MTSVAVVRDDDGQIVGFEASGHSLADETGEDIVCAAITVLFDYLTRILNDLPEEAFTFRQEHSSPLWSLRVDRSMLEKEQKFLINSVFEKAESTFRSIQDEYPESCRVEHSHP